LDKIIHSQFLGALLGFSVLSSNKLEGSSVKLFFCKISRKGSWKALLTTGLKLNFMQSYSIYATRRSVEVFFKENKQYLSHGKCQSQDFDTQIANTTICMIHIIYYQLLNVLQAMNLLDNYLEAQSLKQFI